MKFIALAAAAVFVAGSASAQQLAPSPTLDAIKARGHIECGVHLGLPGFSFANDKGEWTGLDVDYCKALAAAVLGDATKVKFTPTSVQQRWAVLQSGQVDLLSRLARVHEQELGDIAHAIETYRRILDVEYDNKPAVLALDRLYSATAAWPQLTEILRREIQLADGGSASGEVAELQFRLGQTLQNQLGDRRGARHHLRGRLLRRHDVVGHRDLRGQDWRDGDLRGERRDVGRDRARQHGRRVRSERWTKTSD